MNTEGDSVEFSLAVTEAQRRKIVSVKEKEELWQKALHSRADELHLNMQITIATYLYMKLRT